MKENGCEPLAFVEERVDYSHIAPSGFGTADMLIIGGTSLVVYPAAGLINYYAGKKLVLINKSPTGMDYRADLAISAPIGEVFSQITVK